jgi:hypothetical protein
MEPVEFPGHNVVFGKDQPNYRPLPALKLPDGEVITFWKMSNEELDKIIANRGVYLKQLTFNQALQPVCLLADLSDDMELNL